jgi:hypothetical protein
VESLKYLLVCSRSLPDDNSEVDASSISIDISTNNRFYEYTEGQQMNFNCSMIGGIKQKAKITLSIGDK